MPVKQMLLDAKEDLTAFAAFPISHWKEIQSPNPLERINREIKRRTDVVQVFPNPAALERLVTAVLSEMHDEWIAFPRSYLSESSMTAIYAAEHATHTLPNPRTLRTIDRLRHHRGRDRGHREPPGTDFERIGTSEKLIRWPLLHVSHHWHAWANHPDQRRPQQPAIHHVRGRDPCPGQQPAGDHVT
ncbi:hypothetical protein AAW14_37360 [Streptomyces hygroscopicus]|nr:hypothetical protein [Streptomyces hygroscopicus]